MPSRNRKKRTKQRAEYLQKQEENKAKARERYKADPEKKKASVRESYKADPEKKKASVRESYIANIEPKRAAKRQRYGEDLEENRAAKRQRYEKVKLKCCQEGKIFCAKICDLSREDMLLLSIGDLYKGSALLCNISGKTYPVRFISFDDGSSKGTKRKQAKTNGGLSDEDNLNKNPPQCSVKKLKITDDELDVEDHATCSTELKVNIKGVDINILPAKDIYHFELMLLDLYITKDELSKSLTDHFLGVVPNLATVLYALQKGLEELDNETPEGTAALPLPLPEVLVSCSQCNVEKKIIIKYESRIDQHRLLFIGNCNECDCNLNSNGTVVVVKFVQGIYGEKAHRILATEKLAPKLFGIVKVNPIWTAVVMEHIVGHNLEDLLVDKVVINAKVITGLNRILAVLNQHKIVHGDLLPHNFMITTSDDDDYCVRVVDFDWAGDEGSVKYAVYINMELQWPAYWSWSWMSDYTSA
ncbi:hypothetical protein EMCRGX_G014917 [Ephydatia muelleri]